MRTFVGLPCPEAWLDPLMRVQSLLPGGCPVPEENLHLTLAFLDDQPEAALEALHDQLDALALPAPQLVAQGYAPLGSRTPRAVVLDVVRNDPLVALFDAVRRAARMAGMALPRDRFRPHVTLTRYSTTAPADTLRLQGALTRLGLPDLPRAEAPPVTLWSSTLTPDGPIYDVLASYGVPA